MCFEGACSRYIVPEGSPLSYTLLDNSPLQSIMSDALEQMRSRFRAFHRALTMETDRGCALYAAAYLDQALSDLLYVTLVESKSMQADLFEGTAPLASFSSRITLAYYLGKLSPSMRRELNLIRKIRNDFAHSADNLTFETENLANRCKHLQYSYHDADGRPREHFTAAVCGLLAVIHVSTLRSIAIVECPDRLPLDDIKEEFRKSIEENPS